MSFIANLFRSPSPRTPPTVTVPSVSPGAAGSDTSTSAITKTKRGARLALFATRGGAFGIQGRTPTARRKLLGN